MTEPEISSILEPPEEVLISAIEHFSYCPRQCGLIHVEQSYSENRFTLRGNAVHERADSGAVSSSGTDQVFRSIPLWSERFGLRGKADVVEFHGGVPYPVEYKVGGGQADHAALQLCAQALCLEEMFATSVPCGALYHHKLRHRNEVQFDEVLRRQTVAVIVAVRHMLGTSKLPPAVYDRRCRHCSLNDLCLPEVLVSAHRIRGLQSALYQVSDVSSNDVE